MPQILYHFVGGRRQLGRGRTAPVFNPSRGVVTGLVPLASAEETQAAIANAAEAFPAWAATSALERSRIVSRFYELCIAHTDELAAVISAEHGKVLSDAKGSLRRGIEILEFARGVPHLLKGEFSDNVARGMDMYSMRKPLGVVAGITPFNFPAMVPLWMLGIAVACGNTFVLKPSEKNPSCALLMAELFMKAGLPGGVLNVVNGDKEAVDTLIADPRVQAVSFVGSTAVAADVYAKAAAAGKRCQAMGGAKNHLIVMPDADIGRAVDALIGAAYGSAGERCMAISVAVAVGNATGDVLAERLTDRVSKLRMGPSDDPNADFGPLITAAHRDRVRSYVDLAVREGADLLVDGRDWSVPGHEDGFYLGPCLFDNVQPNMTSYREEIFGPVLQIVRTASFDEAIALPSKHRYGNGVSIFTRSGAAARTFADNVEAGMVGVNVPIPVPAAFHSFGGWKASAFGDMNVYGMEGVRFYTKAKTITTRWSEPEKSGAEFVIPNFG